MGGKTRRVMRRLAGARQSSRHLTGALARLVAVVSAAGPVTPA